MEYTRESLIDLNVIQNLKELGGDDGGDFFKEIITLFSDQYPQLLQNITTHAQNKDFDNLSKSAHALKGACLNIGAKELSEICKKIEINSKTHIYDEIDELLNQIDTVHQLTMNEINLL